MKDSGTFKYAILLFFLLLPPLARAQEPSERWQHLRPEEKATIWRNYQRWRALPPQDKEHLREEWNYWQSLPQDRRERLKQRYEELRELPPQERSQLRQKFEEQRKFSPQEVRPRARPKENRPNRPKKRDKD